jgi:para-nitrobenzyl esterase
LAPAPVYALQGNQLLYQQLIADGVAANVVEAAAWVASQPQQAVAAYMRSKTPAALLLTLLSKLAPLGLADRGRSRTARCCRPIRSARSPRQLPPRSGAGRQHARRRQALSGLPAARGWATERLGW